MQVLQIEKFIPLIHAMVARLHGIRLEIERGAGMIDNSANHIKLDNRLAIEKKSMFHVLPLIQLLCKFIIDMKVRKAGQ